VAIQVDQDDPVMMNLVLNNSSNILEHYPARGKTGRGGRGRLRSRPAHVPRGYLIGVQYRIQQIANAAFPSSIQFSARNNTKQGMERREG
jgi:hypothetical protein